LANLLKIEEIAQGVRTDLTPCVAFETEANLQNAGLGIGMNFVLMDRSHKTVETVVGADPSCPPGQNLRIAGFDCGRISSAVAPETFPARSSLQPMARVSRGHYPKSAVPADYKSFVVDCQALTIRYPLGEVVKRHGIAKRDPLCRD